jgi:hypothetical protein
MHMDVGLLENITIGGFKTKIAYWENNLNEKGYNYFFQTNKGGLAVSFLPRGGFVKDKSIFYKIINTIKFR